MKRQHLHLLMSRSVLWILSLHHYSITKGRGTWTDVLLFAVYLSGKFEAERQAQHEGYLLCACRLASHTHTHTEPAWCTQVHWDPRHVLCCCMPAAFPQGFPALHKVSYFQCIHQHQYLGVCLTPGTYSLPLSLAGVPIPSPDKPVLQWASLCKFSQFLIVCRV